MRTSAQLSWCLRKLFPGTQNGVDYLIGQETDLAGNQIADAKIYQWSREDLKQPDEAALASALARYAQEYAQLVAAAKARDQRTPLLAHADALIHTAEDAGQTDRLPALRAYRQALRDVPQQPGFPTQISWPTMPA
jgi:hypothetical protein